MNLTSARLPGSGGGGSAKSPPERPRVPPLNYPGTLFCILHQWVDTRGIEWDHFRVLEQKKGQCKI